MADAKSKEDRVREWWAAWRAEDYSWDGLAKKRWDGWSIASDGTLVDTKGAPAGSHPATLQDYWRDEEKHLIRGDDKTWTRAHCPLAWADGTPTPKAGWGNAEKATLAALFAAKFAEGRAQCQGCVLYGAPMRRQEDIRPWSVRFERAFFSEATNFEGRTFSGSARFDRAIFSGHARFGGATFSGAAHFESVTFSEDARFDRTTFSGTARFVGATFADAAHFEGATFSEGTSFDRATFSASARFSDATFSEAASFDAATFSGSASFGNATFSGSARFGGAAFSGSARFASATFSGSAWFGDATFFGDAWFGSASFCGEARFDSANFIEEANFGDAQFLDEVWFIFCAFGRSAEFGKALFRRGVSFLGQRAVLKKPEVEQVLKLNAVSDTSALTFAGTLASPTVTSQLVRSAFHFVSFRDALFEGDAVFTNRDILSTSEFNNAKFLGTAVFHGASIHQSVSFQGAQFDHVLSEPWPVNRVQRNLYALTDAMSYLCRLTGRRRRALPPFEKWLAATALEYPDHWLFKPDEDDDDDIDARYARIERAYRTLKLAMEQVRNKPEEQQFYRLELRARRHRRDHDVPGWERVLSDVYRGVSDYGGSVVRPLVWLSLVIAPVFWIVFYLWAAALDPHQTFLSRFAFSPDKPVDDGLWRALGFSMHNVFPFGAFGDSARDGFYHDLTPGWRVGIGIVATLQSLSAVTLAFLSGLAVRRRFQIS